LGCRRFLVGHVDWPHQAGGGEQGESFVEWSLEGGHSVSVGVGSLDQLDVLGLGITVHLGVAPLGWCLGHCPVADEIGFGVTLESSVVKLVELVHLGHLVHLIHLVHLVPLVQLGHLGHWVPLVSVHAVLHALSVNLVEGIRALLVLVEGVHVKHVVGSVHLVALPLVHAVGLHSLAVHSAIHLVVARSWVVHHHHVVHSLFLVGAVHLVHVHAVLGAIHLVHVIHAVALVHVESVHLVRVHAEHVIPIVLHAVVGWVVGHDRVGESRVGLSLTLSKPVVPHHLDWVRSSSV